MKFIWEESDFVHDRNNEAKRGELPRSAVGVLVRHKSGETAITGYLAGANTREPRYVKTSLRDGMTQGPFTAAEMANYLNTAEYMPVFSNELVESRLTV